MLLGAVYTNFLTYMFLRVRRFSGEELPTQNLSVVVGAHRLKGEPEASRKRHYIQEAVMHHGYDSHSPTFLNDIMLLRVNASIQFNEHVRPICVDTSVFPTDTYCFVTGWGTTVDFYRK